MNYQHKQLSQGKWFTLSLCEQLANIGSEVERAILWKSKKEEYSKAAFLRALELLELTLEDEKNKSAAHLKEVSRLKEALLDFFCGDNEFSSSDELMRKYFYNFAYASRLKRGQN